MNAEYLRAKVSDFVQDEAFMAMFDRLEEAAVDRGVYAAPDEHDKRAQAFADVRAIRALRSELKALAEGTANPASNVAPA